MNRATLIASTVSRRSVRLNQQSRQMSTAGPLYNAVMSSNAKYVMFILTGACIGEGVFGFATNLVWTANNRGVSLYLNVYESFY